VLGYLNWIKKKEKTLCTGPITLLSAHLHHHNLRGPTNVPAAPLDCHTDAWGLLDRPPLHANPLRGRLSRRVLVRVPPWSLHGGPSHADSPSLSRIRGPTDVWVLLFSPLPTNTRPVPQTFGPHCSGPASTLRRCSRASN
jgi:hypothetical protein